MKVENQLKPQKYRRLVIGDALAVNKLNLPELLMLMSGKYYLCLLPEVMDEVRSDYQSVLLMPDRAAKLKVEYLTTAEKVTAGLMPKNGRSLTDNHSLVLAKRLKAPLLVGDPYWHTQKAYLKDFRLIHVERPALINFFINQNEPLRKKFLLQLQKNQQKTSK